ncbi:MAG: CTP synthase [Candidatus Levybacteria bacterium RIFCSPHIGHO2_12_FULL_38_12]|nr:MAG: CTP synthase [Candidatus Levybacteria bacterium RIFCSPHIGHO2_01_FULL_38_12]OGH22277.1 MAG: CTP synthase [Candidatus Levybacteria bacterium RIFCSPHIGHO2_02_FULL_37_18]OGH23365.1 MAG: CTP synthase [Candidatus Levybacteria bacterium RIFCSPHIGHO2_12_FULL_38_12]OGH34541.1 MAG: CTP synthase [Candidatus Levybacteria bacterium RIFCSPLOWO2_01_FULL_37_20]OGH43422.1 MAG: CTP synthase [Candidatus Levybacteria bacterium RIFCSPLOWO2_02_FULL_37_18]
MKYIFVSGGVISGIGKGTTTASIGLLLKSAGFKVSPIKFENYLNIDAGTINPIEHGDPFLCEDGTEADMDIGTYEKFLDEDMEKDNFVTVGQIYKKVIDRERRFEYNGEDVEAIPHITNEIIARIKNLGKKTNADIVIIELGGTAGEYQNVFYYEAARIMTLQNPGDVIHVHVSYVPTPAHLGEPKTKPTQLSVRTLNSLGIQPDFIIVRSDKPLDQRRKDRLALFCNTNKESVISSPDVSSVYQIPMVLHKQSLDAKILKKLGLPVRIPDLTAWEQLLSKIQTKKQKTIEIAIVGKYFGTGDYQLRDSYAALFDAIDHASWSVGVEVKTKWISAEKVEKEGIETFIGSPDGVIVPIGWGERGAEGMIRTASYAREKKIPYLGLCYGMQLAVIAFARDILGFKDANTTENDPNTKHPVITLMPKQKEFMEKRAYGGTMRLGGWEANVKKNTISYKAYEEFNQFINKNVGLTSERHRHRYEFNNKYTNDFEKKGLIISAWSTEENLAEIIELPIAVHPFYLGTQGHPEYKSRPLKPHPLFVSFIRACSARQN